MNKPDRDKIKAYTTLLTVLILSAVSLAITTSVLLIGTDNTQIAISAGWHQQAEVLAETCIETALQQIRSDDTYTGTDNLTLGTDSCSYTVTNLGGESRRVEIEATVSQSTSRLVVEIDTIYPTLNITTWQNVASF